MESKVEEGYEIFGRDFARCASALPGGGHCASARRFAVRRLHIGLYCGLGPGAHNLPWLPNLPWAKPSDFIEPGPFAGWLPEGAFPPRREGKRRRRGGWGLSESVRNEFDVRVRQRDAKCSACEATWFRGERNSRDGLAWLYAFERFGLYAEVADAVRKMIPKPAPGEPAWYDRLPTDLRIEVAYRFDDSRLRLGHPLSLTFLRAAKQHEGVLFSAAVQRVGVDGLAMPLCGKCHREKGALLFPTASELLRHWAAYRFSGNSAAARLHPDYREFEYLVYLAYQTDIAASIGGVTAQRERRA